MGTRAKVNLFQETLKKDETGSMIFFVVCVCRGGGGGGGGWRGGNGFKPNYFKETKNTGTRPPERASKMSAKVFILCL